MSHPWRKNVDKSTINDVQVFCLVFLKYVSRLSIFFSSPSLSFWLHALSLFVSTQC